MDPKQLVALILQLALMLMIALVGLQARWRDVLLVIERPRGLLKALMAVNVLVPFVAVLVCLALPLATPVKIGLVIMAVSPLAPLVPGMVIRAGMAASRVAGLYVLLALLSVVIVPATLALLSRLFPYDARISVNVIGHLVAISVFAPLAAGMIIAWLAPELAERLVKPLAIVGNIALAIVVLAIVVTQGTQVLALVGNGTLFAMAAVAGAGIIFGHLLGGPETVTRKSLALAAATRHPGIAALVAQANFEFDRQVLLSIALFPLVSVAVSSIYIRWLKVRQPDEGEPAPA